MSKINLFNVSPPQIPEVDNTLEEDSFQASQQFKTNAINQSNNNSKPVQNEAHKTIKDGFQQNLKMSTSQVMMYDQNDHYQVINVQMTNQSQLSMLNSILQSKMQDEIRNYFEACSKKVQPVYCEFKTKLATQITHKIKKQILKGVVNVSDNAVNLKFKSREDQPNPNDLYRELQIKKQQAIQKIKDIETERLNLIAIAKKKNAIKKELKPDILTEEQKKRLVELVKQKRQFEKSINRKDEQLIEEARMRKLNDQRQRQKTFLEQNEKKKIKILENLKILELKSKQRQQHLKNSVLRENHDYTHKRYEKQWKKQEKLMEKQQKNLLQQIHKKIQFSVGDIKQHEKKYSLDLKRRQQQSRQRQSRISHSLPKRQKTNFDRIVEQQIYSIKQKNQQERLKMKQNQFKKKILQYQQIVDAKFKPKLDTSNSFIMPIQRAYSSVSLSKQQRVEIGLQYLAKAKELKKSDQKREKVVQAKILTGYSAYKDYLKEREPTNYNISKRQFSEIVRRPKESYEQLEIAKHMAQGLQAKVKKNPDSKMYQSMKNKLLLLDSLY